MSASFVYDDAAFRAMFPEFADVSKFPQILIEGYWEQALCIFEADGNVFFNACGAMLVINYLCAHMLQIATKANKGRQIGFKTASTIDKISTSMLPPPVRDQFTWWLSTSPYGAQLAALLEVSSVGGFYVGGINERGSFRKGGGGFW
ncbi:putative head-to-tail connector protein [Aeromonas phage Gekk3-15]